MQILVKKGQKRPISCPRPKSGSVDGGISPLFKSTDWNLALLNFTTMQDLGPLFKQTIYEKSKTVLWHLKSAQGLNLRCKTTELSISRKYVTLFKGWVVGAEYNIT